MRSVATDGFERAYRHVDGTRDRFLARLKREGRLDAFQRRVRELKTGKKAKEERQEAWWQACSEFEEPLSPAADDGQGDDLVDAHVFAGKSAPKPAVIGWVADNIGNDVTASDAPSPDAWHLLTWARKAQSNEHTFWRTLYPLATRAARVAADDAAHAEAQERIIAEVSRLALEAGAPKAFADQAEALARDPPRWKRLKRKVDELIRAEVEAISRAAARKLVPEDMELTE